MGVSVGVVYPGFLFWKVGNYDYYDCSVYSFCRNLLLELKVGLIASISMDLNSVILY